MAETSPTLLQRLKRTDDREAWSRFVDIYTPLLYEWARTAGLSEPDARELLQDLFVLLYEKLPAFTYDANKGQFRGWLRTVAVNKLREKARRAREAPVGSNVHLLENAEVAATGFWDDEYRRHLVRRAMLVMQRDFEPRTWKACWETTFSGREAAEVARELEMSVGAVYTARSRVLRRLREELSGMWDES